MIDLPFTQTFVPVEGARLISRQGPRPNRRTWHNGIDLGGVPIGTYVHPISFGVVDAICVDGESCCGYGNAVRVKHADDLYSFYAHLDTINVQVGWPVTPFMWIGTVGNTFGQHDPETGECLTRPMVEHVHLEVQHEGFPFRSRDYAARYDVLEVLAASGLEVGSGGMLVATTPYEYREPALIAAEKTDQEYDEEIVGPELRPSRLRRVAGPVAIVGGVLALTVGAVWVGRRLPS